MFKNDKVSVIIPVYNAQEYIADCIESVRMQTYNNLEIILVNDGSTDGSLEICRNKEKKDSRIVVISKSNKGVVSARKKGIDIATGRYIMFVDSDDYVDRNYVQSLLEVGLDCELVTSGIRVNQQEIYDYIRQGRYIVGQQSPIIKNMIYADDGVSRGIMSCMYAKRFNADIAKEISKGLDDTIYYGEDGEFVYKYILRCRSAFVTKKCNYNYRANDSSITHSKHDDFLTNVNKLYLSLKKEFECNQFYSVLLPQLEKWIFEHIRMSPMQMGFSEDNVPIRFVFNLDEKFLNSNVVIYGAGEVGRNYIRQIKKQNLFKSFMWVDGNYQDKKMFMGENVKSLSELDDYKYDYILLAINSEKTRIQIRNSLIEMGIDSKKIIEKSPIFINEFYA